MRQPTTSGVIQSIQTGAQILREFALARRSLALKDVTKRTGLRTPTAHRYLATLVATDFLVKDDDTKLYALGPLAMLVGACALFDGSISQKAASFMQKLRGELDHTVLLAVWTEHGATVIDWLDSSRPVIVNVKVGSTLPLIRSATGRIFATYLPPSSTGRLLSEELRNSSHAEVMAYQQALDMTHRNELSRVEGDLVGGVAAFSAPIFRRGGDLVGALTILGLAPAFNAAWTSPEATSTRAAAIGLSHSFGYQAAGRHAAPIRVQDFAPIRPERSGVGGRPPLRRSRWTSAG